MGLKQISLVSELENNFLTPQERQRKEVNICSLKHFLFKTASLGTFEIDNLVRHLDKDYDGFVRITELQTALATQ